MDVHVPPEWLFTMGCNTHPECLSGGGLHLKSVTDVRDLKTPYLSRVTPKENPADLTVSGVLESSFTAYLASLPNSSVAAVRASLAMVVKASP